MGTSVDLVFLTTCRGYTVCCLAGPPVEVGVTMYVLSISSVSEVLMVLMTLAMLARSLYLLSESGYETPAAIKSNLPQILIYYYYY